MTTYYIRSSVTGEIVNAVEAQTRDGATRVIESMDGGLSQYFTDDDPPTAVLKRYRYWDERP